MHRNLAALTCGVLLFVLFQFSPASFAQSSDAPQAAPAAQSPAIPAYPDSTSGLEHLFKDVMKAQKENDAALADALLKSMVLPDYGHWYHDNFDDGIAKLGVAAYAASASSLPPQLARFFLEIQSDDWQRIEVVRYEKNCDDNASELTFMILDGRLKPFNLYEGRFLKGDKLRRLFAFVYVDGGFRFLIVPTYEQVVNSDSRPPAQEMAKRFTFGGNVQAARLVKRVQPVYPVTARMEYLSGTVKLHAIIGKDGSVRSLRVVQGRCTLARAAVDAVRQWRYTPVLINGEPIEVDTQIDVIFQLQR
jgi:TonB family protein